MTSAMEYPDYLNELMKELSTMEFLKVAFKKLDDLIVKTPEELLILDKVIYKANNISKDFKFALLTPQFQEKYYQHMKDLKLEQGNFLKMLKPFEHALGPYTTRPKADVTLNLATAPTTTVQDNTQTPFNVVAESNPEPPTIIPSSDKSYRSYGNPQRPVEQGGLTPKRTRTNSSSSSSSSSDSEERRSSSSKPQDDVSRFSAKGGINEKSGRLPAKYSFAIKKPETPRTVRSHAMEDDDYFERSSRAYEPRSERGGEASGRERDLRRSPEPYYPGSGRPKLYKPPKSRPPPSYKHLRN